MQKNKKLKLRILEISYKHKLSHLGSCLTAVDTIDHIFRKKSENDIFVLSQGHAGLAYYVVAEKYRKIDPERAFSDMGIHPDISTDTQGFVQCSTGSLGHGLPIAIGMAIASPNKQVHCLISDGEMAEGSIWESLYFLSRNKIENIKIYINHNGYTGYGESGDMLENLLVESGANCFLSYNENPPMLEGLKGHYQVMDEKMYQKLREYYEA